MKGPRIVVHGLVGTNAVPNILIYGLIDPDSRLIRYIGKSSRGAARPKEHKYTARGADTHNRRWIKSLQERGLIFEIIVLEAVTDVTNLDEAECWWIDFGRACGWRLTNHLDGGALSPETIAKLREREKQKAARTAYLVAEKQRKVEEKQRLRAEYEATEAERIRRGMALIFSPAELADMEERKEEQKRRRIARRTSPAEIERRCFELFEKHADSRRMMIDVVIGARVTPSTAHWLYDVWLRSATRSPRRMAVDHGDLEMRLAREALGEILPG